MVSVQHAETYDYNIFFDFIREDIVESVLRKFDLNTGDYKLLVNPTGRFVIGGPIGDTGLTGRKIIVDTYGGYARHGGGAFSGKDVTKVDRIGAYMARYLAKNIVASGLAEKCEIQLSYAIGIENPISISCNCFETGKINSEIIVFVILKMAHFSDKLQSKNGPLFN